MAKASQVTNMANVEHVLGSPPFDFLNKILILDQNFFCQIKFFFQHRFFAREMDESPPLRRSKRLLARKDVDAIDYGGTRRPRGRPSARRFYSLSVSSHHLFASQPTLPDEPAKKKKTATRNTSNPKKTVPPRKTRKNPRPLPLHVVLVVSLSQK